MIIIIIIIIIIIKSILLIVLQHEDSCMNVTDLLGYFMKLKW